jgi:hypothetical protein
MARVFKRRRDACCRQATATVVPVPQGHDLAVVGRPRRSPSGVDDRYGHRFNDRGSGGSLSGVHRPQMICNMANALTRDHTAKLAVSLTMFWNGSMVINLCWRKLN